MRSFTVLCSFLVLACGSVSNPDNPGGDDTTAPALMATTPASGQPMSVLTQAIEITMDEELDPASVDDDTIVVVDRYGGEVGGEVSLSDDGTTLVFRFDSTRLGWDRQYGVSVAGVADLAGNTSAELDLDFATFVNSPTEWTSWTETRVQRISRYMLDANGRAAEIINFTGPGPDGEWHTSDDDMSGRNVYVRDGWKLERVTVHNGDDEVNTVSQYVHDGNGRTLKSVSYDDPGADGQWYTDDDIPYYVYQYNRDPATGNTIEALTYQGPGPDGMWWTVDDEVTRRDAHTYDSEGRMIRFSRFGSSGPDGVWATEDDVPEYYTVTSYDANGHVDMQIKYTAAGDDGTWFTADDVIVQITDSEYTATGQRSFYLRYVDAGPDGVWRTADDTVTRHSTTYDDNGSNIGGTTSTPGSDGIFDTADDVLEDRQVIRYDDNGNRTSYTRYNGAGPDGEWNTADDAKQIDYTYNTTL